jgi:hypothetical protein
MKLVFISFFLVSIFGCSSVPNEKSNHTAIAVCIIRHFTSPNADLPEKARLVYFLDTQQIGASVSDVIQRLADLPFSYKNASERSKHPQRGNVWDSTLKKDGLIILLTDLKFISQSEVQVTVTYQGDNTYAGSMKYVLRKRFGHWTYSSLRENWISLNMQPKKELRTIAAAVTLCTPLALAAVMSDF